MKTLLLAVLALAFLALPPGCASTIPAAVAHGIAVLDSNTQTLGADYQRALTHGTASIDSATRTRDLGLLHENAVLSRHLSEWAQNHAKGK